MLIRRATNDDAAAIWSTIRPTIRAGETYALAPEMTEAEALSYWMDVVGRLPLAFRHPSLGYVDALVMFRAL
jgi:hypothetical protein